MDDLPSGETLRSLFLETASRFPEDPGVRWRMPDGRPFAIVHSERLARARVIAELASGLGMDAGAKVALFMPFVPAWLDLFLGTASIGAATVALPPSLSPDGAVQILRETGASLLFVGEGQTPASRAIAAALPDVRVVLQADVPYPSAPHPPATLPSDLPDYRDLFSAAVDRGLAAGAAFDRASPESGNPALIFNGREYTHGQLVELGAGLLPATLAAAHKGGTLPDIAADASAIDDLPSAIARTVALPLLAGAKGIIPPCVAIEGPEAP